MDYSFLLLFLAIVLAVAVIYLTILMLKRWYVTFSPKETAFFGLIMFSIGWVLEAYLVGNAAGVLEGSVIDFLFFGLFIYRWNKRRIVRKTKKEAGIL